MSSPFFGLNIGASALRTAQTLVDIANQNIANANTPGYSRQSAVVTAAAPWPIPVFSSGGTPGQLGTGVQITEINRARNTFVDFQMRNQLNTQGQVDAHSQALTQVEAIVNEPSTTGLSSTLSKYWSAWQEVSNSPSDSSIRSNLVEQGKAVADAFHSQISQFSQQQRDLDQQVGLAVTNVNTIANQIASVNKQVSQVEASGMHANDLRDQRDQLVDSLSKLVKINVVESADGQVNINVGNHQLVDRNTVNPMVANTTVGAFSQVQWADTTTASMQGAVAPNPAGMATAATLTINGSAVSLAAGLSPTATMNAINGTPGLGATGAVTASLQNGRLVLTSNTPGAAGSVAITSMSPAGNSISADLGLSVSTITGLDPTAVNLGGGQLQGLIDSRDVLLQERIDGVNNLASRVIESVNAVHASGVGMDGKGGRPFFSGTNAANMAVDSAITAAGGTNLIAAARMTADATGGTYSSATGDSSNAIVLAELGNAITQRATVAGDLTPAQALVAPSATTTVLGIDLSGATANTKYTFSVTGGPAGTAPVVTVNPGGVAAKLTVGVDSAGNKVVTLDSGATRLTLSAPAAGFDLYTAVKGLDTTSVTTNSGPATIGGEYAQQIAAVGVESQTAKGQSTNQGVLINQLTTQRSQTSGVSLDEETMNLITYQKAYQAAARIVTTMDSMLDTLINHTGVL